jgi:purine catabolism regulator
MIAHGITGLVMSVGHYFEHTPNIIIEEADRLGFPIIEVPGSLSFVEITEAIFTRIVNGQYEVLRRAKEIHETLTDIVLDGGTLQDVADILGDLLEKSITIESSNFDVLANTQQGAIDEARIRTIETGRTTPEVIQRLEGHATYQRLLREKRPIRIKPQPELGLDMERIVAPIIVSRQIIGYMWIIADGGPLTELDELAIEQAATVTALFMYKEKAVQESHRTMRGDFFDQLLRIDQISHEQLEGQAAMFDFRLDRRYQVLVIEDHSAPHEEASTLPQRIEDSVRDIAQALIVFREQQIVIVLQARQAPNGKIVASELITQLSQPTENVLIGIGMPAQDVNGIPISYKQAKEALVIARQLGRDKGVYTFNELGLLHWLHQLPEHALFDNWYFRAIHELDQHDTNHNKQLLTTLEAFLESGGSLKDAAKRLYVHRNTLIYRLERIEAYTGLDLRNSQNQINLFVALKTYRMRWNASQNETDSP